MALIALLLLAACDGGKDTGDTDGFDSGPDSGGDSGEPHVPDADGDGHLSYEDGGDDCDDANAYAYPGAEEFCDDVDQDCDGAALAPGVCAKAQDPAASARWLVHNEEPNGGYLGVVADVTGDGQGDLYYGEDPEDQYSVFPGGAWPASPWATPDDAWLTITQTGGAYLTGGVFFDAGDVNGDGLGDLGVISHDVPQVLFYLAPFTQGEDVDMWFEADYRIDGAGEAWGYEAVGNLDFDGDGRADAVSHVGSGLSEGADINVFFGMETERCDIGSRGSGTAVAVGDLTGDGLDDLAAHFGEESWLIDGSLLRTGCGAEESDLAFAWTPATSESEEMLVMPWAAIGDWSGDGLNDAAVANAHASGGGQDAGEIFFFAGGLVGEFSQASALGSYAGETDDFLGFHLWTGDLDGDSESDILAIDTDGYLVIRGGDIPPPHSPLPDRVLRYADVGEGWDQVGIHEQVPPGDVNGDAFADLFVVRLFPDPQTIDIGAVAGFGIPWDDDTYW